MDTITEKLKESQNSIMPCILCHYPTIGRGIFMPKEKDTHILGKPPIGFTRVAIYAICHTCSHVNYSTNDKIETKLMRCNN